MEIPILGRIWNNGNLCSVCHKHPIRVESSTYGWKRICKSCYDKRWMHLKETKQIKGIVRKRKQGRPKGFRMPEDHWQKIALGHLEHYLDVVGLDERFVEQLKKHGYIVTPLGGMTKIEPSAELLEVDSRNEEVRESI